MSDQFFELIFVGLFILVVGMVIGQSLQFLLEGKWNLVLTSGQALRRQRRSRAPRAKRKPALALIFALVLGLGVICRAESLISGILPSYTRQFLLLILSIGFIVGVLFSSDRLGPILSFPGFLVEFGILLILIGGWRLSIMLNHDLGEALVHGGLVALVGVIPLVIGALMFLENR